MRRIWKILLSIIIIGAIFLITFFTFKVFSKKDSNTLENKVTTEIKYLEGNFLNIFNEMNNIRFENYKLSTTESKESTSGSSENQSEGVESSETSSDSSSSSGGSSESESGSSSSSGEGSSQSSEKQKEYSLEQTRVLTSKDTQIQWDNIKNQVEEIYTSISTITLDMYFLEVNHEKILSFNSDFDTLTIAIKNEDKQQTLDSLVKLYNYLPSYLEDFSKDIDYINILKTKYNIFSGYSLLDKSDWANIEVYNNNAIEEFSKVLNNITESKKEVTINKIYVELNEMKNAIAIQDREVYLIKYKNILEDLNSL